MQIDSALSSTQQGVDRSTANSVPVANDTGSAPSAISAKSATSTQDDAVHISAAGSAAVAADQDGNTAQEDAGSDSTATASASESTPTLDASAVQSFAYGTLGLERPDKPQEDSNTFYTAGRWLAAGITIGSLVSLLV